MIHHCPTCGHVLLVPIDVRQPHMLPPRRPDFEIFQKPLFKLPTDEESIEAVKEMALIFARHVRDLVQPQLQIMKEAP